MRLVTEGVVCPPGDHTVVYPGAPPVILMFAVPLFPPAQVTLVEDAIDKEGAAMSFTFATAVVRHPFPSVMVTVYELPTRLLAHEVV